MAKFRSCGCPRSTVAVLAVLGCCVAGSGQVFGQFQFEPRFQLADTFSYEVESQTRQVVKVGGVEARTTINQAMIIAVEVQAATRPGQLTLVYKPRKMIVAMDVNDLSYRFDSRQDTSDVKLPEPIFVEPAKLFAALASTSWNVTLDENRQVVDFSGKDDVLSSLDKDAAASLAGQFDEDYLKRQAQSEFDMLPRAPVRVGQRWRQERELRLEAGQTLKTTVEFTYRGIDDQAGDAVHRIDSKTIEAAFDWEDPPDASVQPQKLEIVESDGYLLFDPRIGDVTFASESLRVKGELKIEIDMLELEGNVDLTLAATQRRR